MKTSIINPKSETPYWIAYIIGAILFALIFTSCHSKSGEVSRREHQYAYMQDTLKWNQFLECSKDQGDAGCDSCFYLVFGYHAENPGYLDYTPTK